MLQDNWVYGNSNNHPSNYRNIIFNNIKLVNTLDFKFLAVIAFFTLHNFSRKPRCDMLNEIIFSILLPC